MPTHPACCVAISFELYNQIVQLQFQEEMAVEAHTRAMQLSAKAYKNLVNIEALRVGDIPLCTTVQAGTLVN